MAHPVDMSWFPGQLNVTTELASGSWDGQLRTPYPVPHDRPRHDHRGLVSLPEDVRLSGRHESDRAAARDDRGEVRSRSPRRSSGLRRRDQARGWVAHAGGVRPEYADSRKARPLRATYAPASSSSASSSDLRWRCSSRGPTAKRRIPLSNELVIADEVDPEVGKGTKADCVPAACSAVIRGGITADAWFRLGARVPGRPLMSGSFPPSEGK